MKWGQRFDADEEVPDELRGKSPREVAEQLKAAQKLQDDIKAAETARLASETKLQEQSTQLEQMRQRMQELEANVQQPTQQRQQETESQEPPSVWTDPQGFVAQQTKGIADVALNAGLMSAKMYFTQNLSVRDRKIFQKYEKEVESGIGTFVPAARVMPQSWMNMFLYVKGVHEADIKKAESENTDFFAETPSRGMQQQEPQQTDKLTDEEAELCRVFHYDPVKYLANKKQGSVKQSLKGAYGNYPVPTRSASAAR